MKLFFKQPIVIISLIFLTIFVIIGFNNDYLSYKDRACIVLDKLELAGGYKSSGNFYLVLKEERGVVFDLIVSPATYSQSDKGEVVHFNLRQMDIKQTPKENVIFFFGPVFSAAIFIVCMIAGIAMYKGSNKKENE